MKITILGSGASAGVPLVGCACAVCTSDDPKNRRTRVSVLIETQGKCLLIDTSPDLRQQCLAYGITRVDAILYTHAHADHVHGIDDVRSLNYHRGGPIPMFTDAATLAELRERFAYAFRPPIPQYGWFRPCLQPQVIVPGVSFFAEGVEVMPFRQQHGGVDSLGFRIGSFVYSTDVSDFPEESVTHLENADLWVVDCLRREAAPTHAHLPLALGWVERFRPKRTVLTHLSHDFDHEILNRETPDQVEPAYDGMVLEV